MHVGVFLFDWKLPTEAIEKIDNQINEKLLWYGISNNDRVLSVSRVRVNILYYCVKIYCKLVILLYGYKQYCMVETAPFLLKPSGTLLMMTLILFNNSDKSQTVKTIQLSDVISMHSLLQIWSSHYQHYSQSLYSHMCSVVCVPA